MIMKIITKQVTDCSTLCPHVFDTVPNQSGCINNENPRVTQITAVLCKLNVSKSCINE